MKWILIATLISIPNSLEPAVGTYATHTLKERIQELEKGVFDCASGRAIRVYFNEHDWIEMKCHIVGDNLWDQRPIHKKRAF